MRRITQYTKTSVVILAFVFGVLTAVWFLGDMRSGVPTGGATASADTVAISDLSSAFERVARNASPSVVHVSTVTRARVLSSPSGGEDLQSPFPGFPGQDFFKRFFGELRPRQGYETRGVGTGAIVSADGYILSNNHVVAGADEITVKLQNGETYPAKLIGTDDKADLAVLKIDARGLTPAKLGDSDAVKVGQWVLAVGNPFGLDETVTAGIVSAKGRANVGIADYEDFIQTDAAINPGNSGGPLLNLKGEVIGINTAIASRSGGYMGIGFAIPTSMARSIMDSLIKYGKVTRGWLGVSIQNLDEKMASSFNFHGTEGVLVGDVAKSSPAEEAGMQSGDIIVTFNGKKVKNANELRNAVAAVAPGTSVPIDIYREGKEEEVKVKIGESTGATASTTPTEVSGELGIHVQALTPALARELGVDESTSGVVITGVEPGSIAGTTGIRQGDVITSLNGKKIESPAQFAKAMAGADLKRGIRLQILRDGFKRFVFLEKR